MKNLLVKSSLILALVSSVALAQGAFVGGEGDYSFNSKIKTKNIASSEKNNFKKGHYGLAIELMAVIIMTLKLGKMLVNQMQNGVSINF